jgi:rhodanese-related sulfurtransferase
MASRYAARRASEAGYHELYVMEDGIDGWRAAGEPTVSLESIKASSPGGS